MSSCDIWTFGLDVKNHCTYNKDGERQPAGDAYKFIVFALVFGVLMQTLAARQEYPHNRDRNVLHITLRVAAIMGYVRFAARCRNLTGFLVYLGLLILGSVAIDILILAPPRREYRYRT
jgi:hypothetical protein